jgi:hypothetical protein
MVQYMLQSDSIFRLQHIGLQLPIEFGCESICSKTQGYSIHLSADYTREFELDFEKA